MKPLLDIFRKKPARQPVIVVSGLPRSGTSLLMMMLEAGGIAPLTDQVRTADDDNPKGYYEFEQAKKLRDGDFSWLPQAQGKVVKVISALLLHLPADYTYQVLFVRRTLPEILASQRKMLINRGEDPNKVSDEEMTQHFTKHLARVEAWLSNQENISVLYVDYNSLLQEPMPDVRRINTFLGEKLDVDKMVSVIDPNLYRQRVRR